MRGDPANIAGPMCLFEAGWLEYGPSSRISAFVLWEISQSLCQPALGAGAAVVPDGEVPQPGRAGEREGREGKATQPPFPTQPPGRRLGRDVSHERNRKHEGEQE